jgi:phosphohistidine swiveling domain-containing protein
MHHEDFSTPLRALIDDSLTDGCPPEVLVQELRSEARQLEQEQRSGQGGEKYPWPMIARGRGASQGWTAGPVKRVTIDDHSQYHPQPECVSGLSAIGSDDIVVTPEFAPWMWDKIVHPTGLLIYDEEQVTGVGAVGAREYGIPTVIGCPEVASRIATGDVIALNGTTGAVFRLQLQQQREEVPQYD